MLESAFAPVGAGRAGPPSNPFGRFSGHAHATLVGRHASGRPLLQMSGGADERGQTRKGTDSAPKPEARAVASIRRRRLLVWAAALIAVATDVLFPAFSAAEGLLGRLQARDWKKLSKPLLPSVVALPLQDQTFPEWMLGTWKVSTTFAGFELPVKTLSKETLMADKSIPGFQKLSVAQIPDVGATGRFLLRFKRRDDGKVVEDKAYNIASMIDNGLGVRAVKQVVTFSILFCMCTWHSHRIQRSPNRVQNSNTQSEGPGQRSEDHQH